MPNVIDAIKRLEHEISRANIPTYGTDFIDCVEVALLRDALDLLKAQEPKVMSEVELREIQAETPVWIEIPFEGCDIGHWALISYQHYNYPGVRFSFDDGALDGMGVKWRCWTSRPDEATREAIPWN